MSGASEAGGPSRIVGAASEAGSPSRIVGGASEAGGPSRIVGGASEAGGPSGIVGGASEAGGLSRGVGSGSETAAPALGAADTGYKRYFGYGLAERLASEIVAVRSDFPADVFLADVHASELMQLELLGRVGLLADALQRHLPADYDEALDTLVSIFGPENPNETGMFTFGHWLWPVGTFIARYGVEHYEPSVAAIEALTTRHTGEYAIRPYVVAEPDRTVRIMRGWATSKNVHVRRLASEGLRPRLPWAQRMNLFVEDPTPVLAVLERLKDDPSRFVQKSVANHLNDYLKDNRPVAMEVLRTWSQDAGPPRRWIIRHALRNERKREAADALEIIARSEG